MGLSLECLIVAVIYEVEFLVELEPSESRRSCSIKLVGVELSCRDFKQSSLEEQTVLSVVLSNAFSLVIGLVSSVFH